MPEVARLEGAALPRALQLSGSQTAHRALLLSENQRVLSDEASVQGPSQRRTAVPVRGAGSCCSPLGLS